MNATSDTEFAAFVGIDWADRKHDVCVQAVGSCTKELSVLAHRPESIAQWAEGLRRRFGGRPIAVCLEIAKASHREIQHLTGRLIEAHDAERARIARDLYDDASQQLAGLSIALSALKRRMDALDVSAELQADLWALAGLVWKQPEWMPVAPSKHSIYCCTGLINFLGCTFLT